MEASVPVRIAVGLASLASVLIGGYLLQRYLAHLAEYPAREMKRLTWAGRRRVQYGAMGFRLNDPAEAALAVRVARVNRYHLVPTYGIIILSAAPAFIAGFWAIGAPLLPVAITVSLSSIAAFPVSVWWGHRSGRRAERLNSEVAENPEQPWPKPSLLSRRSLVLFAVVFAIGLASALTQGVGEGLRLIGYWAAAWLLILVPWWIVWRRP